MHCEYSRSSVIRTSIIRILDYPNWILREITIIFIINTNNIPRTWRKRLIFIVRHVAVANGDETKGNFE